MHTFKKLITFTLLTFSQHYLAIYWEMTTHSFGNLAEHLCLDW